MAASAVELDLSSPEHPDVEAPALARGRGGLLPSWEDALTLLLTAAAFGCVAANVQNADWVAGLPSLFPIGLSALLVAYALYRVRWNQLLLVAMGLVAGAAIVYAQIMAIVPGQSLYWRTAHLHERMYAWWAAVTGHGRSTDPLPVIVIMVAMTWVGAFVGAWAILRWRNAILGLAPGAAALIWDAAFSTDELSVTSVVYLVLGVLLFMRLRVLRQQTQWERAATPYPRFIALSALHVTLWATLALLASAAVMPLGSQSAAANARWESLVAPFTGHLTPIARAFLSINPDKGAKIHGLKDQLILQGLITPRDVPAASVEVSVPPDVAPFLRDQSFQQYRRDGWQVNTQNDESLPPGGSTDVADAQNVSAMMRATIVAQVKVQGGNGDRLFTIGQPLRSDQSDSSNVGGDVADVSSIEPDGHLKNGTQYSTVGSVSAATEDQLRAAGADYPSWVMQSYLQTSRRTPARVAAKARDVAAGTDNPYDAATAIEAYLRSFPIDYSVPKTPDQRDPVDYFLFDAQRGYFDYHASAMTVMLRTLGIPARLASGFVLDPSVRRGDSHVYDLTQQQAFAWPEVYFPNIGWVEFNPTPSQPVVSRPLEPQTTAPEEAALPPPGQSGTSSLPSINSLPSIGDAISGVSLTTWRDIGLGAAVVAVAAALIALLWTWESGVRGLGLRERLWENSVRLASIGHAPPAPDETPRAYASRVALAVPEAGDVEAIAASYERARFGNKQMSPGEAKQLRAAWATARTALVREALRWKRRPSTGDEDLA